MYLLHQQVAYTRKQNTYLKQYMYLTVLTSVNIMLTSLQQMTCEVCTYERALRERAERKSSSVFWPQLSVASLNFRKTHVASLTGCSIHIIFTLTGLEFLKGFDIFKHNLIIIDLKMCYTDEYCTKHIMTFLLIS